MSESTSPVVADAEGVRSLKPRWSTRKKDAAPKGLFRHPGGGWGIRFACSAGHIHEEKVGPSKTDAGRVLSARRLRAHDTAAWWPRTERHRERERARAEEAREASRLPFRAFAETYQAWAKLHHRGWRTEHGRVAAMIATFGETKLDAVMAADVEQFLDGLLATRSQATRNRYRTTAHALFNRARRHGLVAVNPVTGTPKGKEPDGRVLYLTPDEEALVLAQLAPEATAKGRPRLDARRATSARSLSPASTPGLRWSEQRRLAWRDVDLLTRLLTVRESKSGHSRQVPMNRVVRATLLDLGAQRSRPDDPEEPVFPCQFAQPDKFFPKAVERAQDALRQAKKGASRLDGYTWHCNRHTFASRLVMAGVDLRSVQVLGGWRTLAKVQRYSHLAPDRLRAAVERLVPVAAPVQGATPLRENFESAESTAVGVS